MDRPQLEKELARIHAEAWEWALTCTKWNPDLADDVLQESYARIFGGEAQRKGGSSFRTWLFGVIRRVALEHRRQWKGRRRNSPSALASVTLPSPTKLPDETAEDNERARQLQIALQQLPDRQREVLELVFFQDLTLVEVAAIMGISVGTVSTHYKRGKRRLRKELSGVWKD